MEQLLYIGGLEDLTHRNNLFIHHDSRHTHNAVSHDLFHVGDILYLYGQPQCLDSGLGVLVLLMAGFAACAQDFDAGNAAATLTAVGRFSRLVSGATAAAGSFLCRSIGTAAAASGGLLFFLFFLFVKLL